MEAGGILIITAVELMQTDIEIVKTIVNPDKIDTVWIGSEVTTDMNCDVYIDSIDSYDSIDEIVEIIKENMQEKGIIFKPW